MTPNGQSTEETPRGIGVDGLSLIPLMLAPFRDETQLATATGFVVKSEETPFLITNRHVVVGGVAQGIPNKLNFKLRAMMSMDFCKIVSVPLLDTAQIHQWFEHPTHADQVDVIALPIPNYPTGIAPNELDLNLKDTDMDLLPTEQVTVIGYPFGQSAGGLLPIWVNGALATDFAVDWNGLPAFLISSTTKPSMSGSMVIARRIGSVRTSQTNVMNGRVNDKFLGVYSGRLRIGEDFEEDGLDSHIGVVWRANLVEEILSSAMQKMRDSNDPRLNPARMEGIA